MVEGVVGVRRALAVFRHPGDSPSGIQADSPAAPRIIHFGHSNARSLILYGLAVGRVRDGDRARTAGGIVGWNCGTGERGFLLQPAGPVILTPAPARLRISAPSRWIGTPLIAPGIVAGT